REQFVDQLARDLRVLVHLADPGTDFSIRELPDAVAEQPFVFRQRGQRQVAHVARLRRQCETPAEWYIEQTPQRPALAGRATPTSVESGFSRTGRRRPCPTSAGLADDDRD